MQHPLIPPRFLVVLLLVGILLPITLCVVLGVAALLVQMGDSAGGGVLYRIALAGGILWVVNLICLVLVLAIGSLRGPDEPDETP
jgi:type VI protein secretion system component VasK